MRKRINLSLPVDTIELMDRLTGNRSRFVADAVRHYVQCLGRKRLRAELKEGARARSDRDLELAEEWFPLDQEAWPEDR